MPYSILLRTNCQLNKAEPKSKDLFSAFVSQTWEALVPSSSLSGSWGQSGISYSSAERLFSVLEPTKQDDSKLPHGCPWQTFPIVNPLWRRCLAELSEKCVLTWEEPLARAAESHVTKITGEAPNTALPFTASQSARQRGRAPPETPSSKLRSWLRQHHSWPSVNGGHLLSPHQGRMWPEVLLFKKKKSHFFPVSFRPKFH